MRPEDFPRDVLRLTAAIAEDGIAAARQSYKGGDKLDGSIKGFTEFAACRSSEELSALARRAAADCEQMRQEQAHDLTDYWFWRCRQAEIDWGRHVLGCALSAQALADPRIGGEWATSLTSITAGQYMMAARIIERLGGVEDPI